MWTTWAFWKDATWRSFRTFCQTLTGLLITQHISNAFNAPWVDIIGASVLAGLTSLLMSVDRSTEVAQGGVPVEPVRVDPVPVAFVSAEAPVATVTPIDHPSPVSVVCGDTLR